MIDIKNLNKGESVICILNTNTCLKIGKEYVVEGFYDDDLGEDIIIKNDKGEIRYYSIFRFVTKSKYRDFKIEEINTNLSITDLCKKISKLIELRKDDIISYHETLEKLYELLEILEKNNIDFNLEDSILEDSKLNRFNEES